MTEKEFFDALEALPLFEAIHLLEHHYLKGESYLGSDTLPENERISLSVLQKLGYEANQLVSISKKSTTKLHLKTNLMGLTGEQGILPNHYSERIIQRIRENDEAMSDFFDIFNHRLLSLYYRCWLSSQLTAQLCQVAHGQSAPIHTILSALTGDQGDSAIFLGGAFHRRSRSKAMVKTLLEMQSGCSVVLHEFQGRWFDIEVHEQTRICSPSMPEGQFAQLGSGALIGKRSWNMNAGIEIELVATDAQTARALLQCQRLEQTKILAKQLLGESKQIKWKLTAERQLFPKANLSKGVGTLGKGSVLAAKNAAVNKQITITI
ncbi:type VI secretion system baseplate subunit TssG [Vibrio cincinnatiensis]|uniref:type VI secretion system baseplate subunit TssG n=1 Tax=Vibrio cincinnatiensis TaxID=675 RepID=UPI001EDDF440|nr:type VI secretion system baseplate subunit TssG [Vibrio cincinnatiensis]MCG3733391.1 type VI secretion system baseplate subunit TssG [Vibrio cincinnatiensis]MCG3740766.1 type VI secretion system baseplate subunit TssG [Vibrio cincinnatiensis]MCG3744252.1 type VI secretion system baseplate subunit TssG [Vibrio cincinnatiensis]MCG3761991.1 type VI secretion system baseplate subunit TssG [Vibrio cincinnatiensis]